MISDTNIIFTVRQRNKYKPNAIRIFIYNDVWVKAAYSTADHDIICRLRKDVNYNENNRCITVR